MSNLRAPIPMLSPLGWDSSTDSGLPGNAYVLAALESFDSDIKAIESYKAASLFCNSKDFEFSVPSGRRARSHPESLERILNWSFIVSRKSVFYWNPEDIKQYLAFLEVPDVSWVGSTSYSRFVHDRNIPYEEWRINESWKPFKRKVKDGISIPLEGNLAWLDKERRLVLSFFEFIASSSSYTLSHLSVATLRELRSTIPKKRPTLAGQRAYCNGLIRLYPHELDWIFGKAAELRETHWYFNIILFGMAVMRYTDIPLRALCRGYGRDGSLSQFKCGVDNFWRFTDRPGLASEKIYKLDEQMNVYLKAHVGYLCVPFKRILPDIDIFTRPGADQGFGYYHLTGLMETFRAEICQLVENDDDPITFVSRDILSKLSFRLIRRSRLRALREPKKRGRPRQF